MTKKEKRIIAIICKKIRPKFVKRFGNDLFGGCWHLSDHIQKELYNNNIYSKLIQGQYNRRLHYWLEYRGNIIDVTATQFNTIKKRYPKILIKPISRLKEFKAKSIV